MPTTTTLLLLLLLATLTTTLTTTTASSDHYLLSCGASPSVSSSPSSYDNQTWYTDNNSTFSDNFSSSSTTTSAQIPFSTARIFTANLTYSFPVSPGPKFIRLFFFPPNSSYSDSYLTLHSSTNHLLLRNFSAYSTTTIAGTAAAGIAGTAVADDIAKVSREFYVHVDTSQLQLTFYPTPPSTCAFINGIEITSVPDTLYVGPTEPKNVAHPEISSPLPSSTALETAYRLNVGGNELGPAEDTGNMGRRWAADQPYLRRFPGSTGYAQYRRIEYTTETPNYTAPDLVYRTFRWMGEKKKEKTEANNVTWEFAVDGGFSYMVRLHWCEVAAAFNASGFRVFDVYLDGMVAEKEMDVLELVKADTAMYRDYVVYEVGEEGGDGVLRLEMHPSNTDSVYKDILLNGLELFKISRENGSLDAPNPVRLPPPQPSQTHPPPPPPTNSKSTSLILAISGASTTIIALTLFLLCRSKKPSSPPTKPGLAALPSDLCRRFTISEIKQATSGFHDSNIIGRGGFGNVYKGTTDDGLQVAIKRLNPQSRQGAHEFKAELGFLSVLRHVNLVSLVGFSDEANEMVLVYDYMTNGTLSDQLPNLPWTKRLEVSLGAARGLHYLHAGTDRMIIHRDIKGTNILLDENLVAKVSDFGLSRLGPAADAGSSHVTTRVMGTLGYLDPEYYKRQQLTEKSDVYSFGVVLFEVLCGRAAVNNVLPKEEVNLALWGRRNQVEGTLWGIVDRRVSGEIAPECLRKFGEVAESCVRGVGVERPCMEEVVGGLELALRLQKEAATRMDDGGWCLSKATVGRKLDVELGTLLDSAVSLESGDYTNMKMSKSSSEMFSGSSDQGYSGSTTVFSQIHKQGGR